MIEPIQLVIVAAGGALVGSSLARLGWPIFLPGIVVGIPVLLLVYAVYGYLYL